MIAMSFGGVDWRAPFSDEVALPNGKYYAELTDEEVARSLEGLVDYFTRGNKVIN